jgi:beta-xylosidase
MKKLRILFGLLITCVVAAVAQDGEQYYAFSYFKGNGEDGLHLAVSIDGLAWKAVNNDSSFLKPAAGKDKLMRDPCIIKGKDGLYHMVWTVSWNEKSIGYASSIDLITWSVQQNLPVMEHEPDAKNCWAPEIFYDDRSEQYVIFWATTIPGKFPATDQNGDDRYNHRMYFTSTEDFRSFSPTKLFYDPGFNVIDATIIKDGKQYVMILKDETKVPVQKNLKLAFARKAEGPYGPASEPITESWVEGPTLLKIRGAWHLYYDQYTRHQMGGRVSRDLKKWNQMTALLSFPAGARHGTVLEISREDYERLLKMK